MLTWKGGIIIPVYSNKDYINIIRPLPAYIERDFLDIPYIQPENINISFINNGLWLINLKNISKNDKHPQNKIIHSFCFDRDFKRFYNAPNKHLSTVSKYLAFCTFDFSMDKKMDCFNILNAVYRNRWIGAYFQSFGIRVIPTVGWVTSETYDICFSGLKDGGVFIISTLGANNTISYTDFIEGYKEMRKRFPNTQIICVGDRLKGMEDDICYVAYEDTFGNNDKYRDFYQPKLFNWDNTITEGDVYLCHQEEQ